MPQGQLQHWTVRTSPEHSPWALFPAQQCLQVDGPTEESPPSSNVTADRTLGRDLMTLETLKSFLILINFPDFFGPCMFHLFPESN